MQHSIKKNDFVKVVVDKYKENFWMENEFLVAEVTETGIILKERGFGGYTEVVNNIFQASELKKIDSVAERNTKEEERQKKIEEFIANNLPSTPEKKDKYSKQLLVLTIKLLNEDRINELLEHGTFIYRLAEDGAIDLEFCKMYIANQLNHEYNFNTSTGIDLISYLVFGEKNKGFHWGNINVLSMPFAMKEVYRFLKYHSE